MFKLAWVFVIIAVSCGNSIFLSPETSGALVGSLLKGLASPAEAPIDDLSPLGPIGKGGCPLCDRSVYSYCSQKMLYDACCCNQGVGLSFVCPPTDCSYLNAKSCYEYSMISTCCCNNPYH